MYFSNYLSFYVTIITILLFVVPLFLLTIKRRTFRQFTIYKLIMTFNRTLVYYGIFSIILLTIMKIIDITVYGRAEGSSGNDITEIIMGVGYSYVVIGAFFYLPCVGLLNLLNFIAQKNKKDKFTNY